MFSGLIPSCFKTGEMFMEDKVVVDMWIKLEAANYGIIYWKIYMRIEINSKSIKQKKPLFEAASRIVNWI